MLLRNAPVNSEPNSSSRAIIGKKGECSRKKEKEAKSGESVEEDGFVLVLDREEDSDGDGSPRQVR